MREMLTRYRATFILLVVGLFFAALGDMNVGEMLAVACWISAAFLVGEDGDEV